jgi:putative hydrolase of the HAD superfamily
VVPRVTDPYREAFEQEAVREPHIDHITDDLAAFLAACVLPEAKAEREPVDRDRR